jgi:8-oxo-dGTP diphosphatase
MDPLFTDTVKGPLYVAGFLFGNNKTQVALITKARPDWQKGKLNGIGGKVQETESVYTAMRREFKEEAGADVYDWKLFCILSGKSETNPWTVAMFKSECPVEIKTMEDEPVGWYLTSMIEHLNVIPNLKWLIPMAMADNEPFAEVVEG